MRYIALIQKRTEYGNRHYMMSNENESKDSFVKRVKSGYTLPHHYWEVEIYELGNFIDRI